VPPECKHPSRGDRQVAERQFVGREEFVAPVESALKEPPRTKPLVLVFHGGAGIGKSRLRRELVQQLARDPDVLTATLDFDVTGHRHPESALFFLRKTLGEAYEARFPSFDIAYAIYWQKTHPDTPLASGDMTGLARLSAEENRACTHSRSRDGGCTKEAPESGSLLTQLLDETGRLPLIGLIPKLSKLLAASLDPSTPIPLDPSLRSWWERRGERELEDIPQMEPGEIVEQLPKLWAADLKEHLGATSHKPQATSGEGGGSDNDERRTMNEERGLRRAVLFIDSYEKLWEMGGSRQETVDSRQKMDEWVRELVTGLPEVLWVICGRQKLRWEEKEADWGKALSQHELGALPEKSARRFLESCDVTDGQLQDAIVKGSQGVPHYLNLAADAVQNAEGKVQNANLAGGSPEGLVEGFTRQLDKPEAETLRVLSAARFWYYGLFEQLTNHYQTGYPLTGYDDLARFSFIRDGATPGTRTMHELMREALQENQPPELRKSVHRFLYEYYAKQLEGLEAKGVTDQHLTALVEAFYHGRQAKSAAELWPWFGAAADVFENAGQYRLLAPLSREIFQALETEPGPSHPDTALALLRLGAMLTHTEDYEEAEPLLRRALTLADAGQGPKHPHYPEFLSWLSKLLMARGRYEEAEALARRLVGRLESEPGSHADSRVPALDQLASALILQRKYDEAEVLFRRALAVSETELGPDHSITAAVLDNLAALFFEQYRFSEALPLRRRALRIKEQNLRAHHPEALISLANLATTLHGLCRYAEAEQLYRRVLQIEEKILGPESASTAVTMNNLANLLLEVRRYADAELLLRRALAVHERKVGPHHPYTARIVDTLIYVLATQGKHAEAEPMALRFVADSERRHGPDHLETARALNRAGDALSQQGRYAEAESYLRRALEIRTRALGPEHRHTLQSLGGLASLEKRRGRYAEAESLCRDVVKKRERTLGPEHPEVARAVYFLADLCCRAGRSAEAESLYRRVLAVREKVFGPYHTLTAETLEGLAKVCEQSGRAVEAQELSSRAKAIHEKNAEAAQAQATSPS